MNDNELIDVCQTKLNELEEIIKKINPRMNEFTQEYQINMKFKILQCKFELCQIYNESKMTVMVGHSIAVSPMLDAEFCLSKISEFLDELNNL